MKRNWCYATPTGVRMVVQVMPNARKTEVIGLFDDALKIRLQAQPIDGKANDALIRFFAETLDISKSAVLVTHGHTSRRKILEIHAPHLTAAAIEQALLGACAIKLL